jgi:hypothetical protein
LMTTLLLSNYAEIHFTNEEMCLHRHKWPMAEKNRKAYERVVRMAAELDHFFSLIVINWNQGVRYTNWFVICPGTGFQSWRTTASVIRICKT